MTAVPLRNTSLPHLRDGFSRALVARMKVPSVAAAFDDQAGEVNIVFSYTASSLFEAVLTRPLSCCSENWSCSRRIQIFLSERKTRFWSTYGTFLLGSEPLYPLPNPRSTLSTCSSSRNVERWITFATVDGLLFLKHGGTIGRVEEECSDGTRWRIKVILFDFRAIELFLGFFFPSTSCSLSLLFSTPPANIVPPCSIVQREPGQEERKQLKHPRTENRFREY